MEYIEPFDDPDLDNPYAPPKAVEVRSGAMPELGGIPFTAADVFNWSWTIYKDNLGITLGLVIGAVIINIVIDIGVIMAGGALSFAGGRGANQFAMSLGADLVVRLVCQIVNTWFSIGIIRGLLLVGRGQAPSFDIVFSGGRYILSWIIVMILGFLIWATAAAPVGLIAGLAVWIWRDSPASLVGFLVAFVLAMAIALYFWARLYPALYVVIDRDAGPIDAIRMSWQLTRNRAGTIILLYFLEMAVMLLGFFAVCVGLIFAYPLVMLIQTVTYLALTGKAISTEPIRATWEEEL